MAHQRGYVDEAQLVLDDGAEIAIVPVFRTSRIHPDKLSLVRAIAERIASGTPKREACLLEGVAARSLARWMAHPEAEDAIEQALAWAGEVRREALEHAAESASDAERVPGARLQVDTLRWQLERLHRDTWGAPRSGAGAGAGASAGESASAGAGEAPTQRYELSVLTDEERALVAQATALLDKCRRGA